MFVLSFIFNIVTILTYLTKQVKSPFSAFKIFNHLTSKNADQILKLLIKKAILYQIS